MIDAFQSGFDSLIMGFGLLTVENILMIAIGCALLLLGNLMKESGVVSRLARASENEIISVVTLLLGFCIGATMEGSAFLRAQTLLVLVLGFLAICLDTITGVLFGKLMRLFTKGRINPLL
jgi:oxaloacetate decarboxylase beta subunit